MRIADLRLRNVKSKTIRIPKSEMAKIEYRLLIAEWKIRIPKSAIRNTNDRMEVVLWQTKL